MKNKIIALAIGLFALAVPMRYAFMNFDGHHHTLPTISFLVFIALVITAVLISNSDETESESTTH